MDLFIKLMFACFPLLIYLGLWFISGKKLSVDTKSIANLLMFIITPFVVFDGIYKVELNIQTISIPIFICFFACLMCLLGFFVWKFLWKDNTRNLLALSAWKWNFLYFGLPLAIALLWDSSLPLWILMTMWFIIYENTLWMYITAKWNFSTIESIKKVLKMPSIRAFILWIIANLSWFHFDDIYNSNIVYFKWITVVLWTMVIWMALAEIKVRKINWKFILSTFTLKFAIRPLLTVIMIFIDKNLFQFYNSTIYNILFIVSLVPLSANSIAIAKIFNMNTDDVSVAILFSTIFALIFIPLVIWTIWLF